MCFCRILFPEATAKQQPQPQPYITVNYCTEPNFKRQIKTKKQTNTLIDVIVKTISKKIKKKNQRFCLSRFINVPYRKYVQKNEN